MKRTRFLASLAALALALQLAGCGSTAPGASQAPAGLPPPGAGHYPRAITHYH